MSDKANPMEAIRHATDPMYTDINAISSHFSLPCMNEQASKSKRYNEINSVQLKYFERFNFVYRSNWKSFVIQILNALNRKR